MPKTLLHPKYWPLWLGLFILRLLVLLPYRWQLALGRILGLLIYYCMPKRRHISATNIALCFPGKSLSERQALVKVSFKSLGMGVMEALMAWFMSDRRFKKIPFQWQGREYYEATLKSGHGIIGLGGHFTCLEISGRFFGGRIPLNLVYKASRNPFFEYIVSHRRKRYAKTLIKHIDVRAMVRHLRQHEVVWYAPDQDFGLARSVWCSWFGTPTATITGVSTLAKRGHALVIPLYFRRLPKGGYEAVNLAPLENFPSGDEAEDAARWQKLLEDFVRQYPEEYLWAHRRFKTRPEGLHSVY